MTTKVDGLTLNCVPRQDAKEWSASVAIHQSSQGSVPTRDGEGTHQDMMVETDKGQPGKPNVRKARVVRVDAAAGGAESHAVGGLHG